MEAYYTTKTPNYYPPNGSRGAVELIDKINNIYSFIPNSEKHFPPDCPVDDFDYYIITREEFCLAKDYEIQLVKDELDFYTDWGKSNFWGLITVFVILCFTAIGVLYTFSGELNSSKIRRSLNGI